GCRDIALYAGYPHPLAATTVTDQYRPDAMRGKWPASRRQWSRVRPDSYNRQKRTECLQYRIRRFDLRVMPYLSQLGNMGIPDQLTVTRHHVTAGNGVVTAVN